MSVATRSLAQTTRSPSTATWGQMGRENPRATRLGRLPPVAFALPQLRLRTSSGNLYISSFWLAMSPYYSISDFRGFQSDTRTLYG